MGITRLLATRIGAHARRYLSEESRTGVVVSTFRHGFNALFGEDINSRFVAFQTQDVPLHPWAIELPDVVPDLEPLASCSAEAKSVRFKNGHIVSFASATVNKLGIQSWNRDEMACVLRNRLLVKASVDTSMLVADAPRLEAEIMTLLFRERLPDHETTLGGLVGRGRGSTPAGDDALLGMLAALIAQAATSQHARLQLEALRNNLQCANLFKQTTLASAQMIRAGLEGSFPEPVCALVTDLKQANIMADVLQRTADRVLAMGATSGWFLLTGFMSAISLAQRAATESERRRHSLDPRKTQDEVG